MSQTEATRQGDWVLPPCINAQGSSNACAFSLTTTPQVVDLNSISSPPDLHDAATDARDHGPLGHFICVQAQNADANVIFGPSFASMNANQVSSAVVTQGGSGYILAPTVSVSVGGGSGAAGTFVYTGGSNIIASVTMTAAGSGYVSAPTVTVSGGSLGTGATFTASIFSSVGSLFVSAAGSAYGSAPTITITGGGGSGAAGTAVLSGTTLSTITLTAAGSGYVTAPTIAVSGGAGGGGAVTGYIFSSVSGVAVLTGGSLYPAASAPSFAAGVGSGATATAQISTQTGLLTGITITAAGSYSSPPSFTLSGGSYTGAQGAVQTSLGTTPSATTTNAVNAATGAISMNPAVTAWIPNGHTATFKLPEGAPGPNVPWGQGTNWRYLGFVTPSGSGFVRVWQSSI